MSEARISICGVVEYACHGSCNDYIREHEAVWIDEDGRITPSGGHPYCPVCAPKHKNRPSKAVA